MHRRPLLELLDRYQGGHPDEEDCIEKIRTLVSEHRDCFDRTCMPGHITASSWIVSSDHDRYLMTHHRKLDRWLQLGGHADGDTEVVQVALREACEESGMSRFRVLGEGSPIIPLDVDVHEIPARPNEPAHEHHDIRFLLVAEPGQSLEISHESNDLRWFPRDQVEQLQSEESLRRLWQKADRHLR